MEDQKINTRNSIHFYSRLADALFRICQFCQGRLSQGRLRQGSSSGLRESSWFRLLAASSLLLCSVHDVTAQTPQERFIRILPAIQLLLDTGLPGPDGTLALDGIDQSGYGRAYGDDVDEINIDFENAGEDLVLSVKGFDVDSNTEIEILLNGQQVGFLSQGLNGGLSGGDSFTLPVGSMLPGTNRLTFRVVPPGEDWGIAEIVLQTVPEYSTRSNQLGLPTLFDEEWNEVSVRQVLDIFAFGGLATDFQIITWGNMRPEDAILEMLNFSQHNLKLAPVSPTEKYPDAQFSYGTLASFADDYLANPASNLPISVESRDSYARGRSRFDEAWTRMAMTRGLNPFRQRIGFWETNYHMSTNLRTDVNDHQIARIYDDVMNAHEAGEPYQDIIAKGAISAAVATQYGHRFNYWFEDQCWCNEDFAREYHQLFFGILGVEDPLGVENHESVTIKNTAKALTHMVVDYDPIIERLPEWVYYLTPYHYPGNLTLNILNTEIPGTNAKERIEFLSQIAIEHSESLKNLPVKIITGLADDDLDAAETLAIQNAWQSMGTKNFLTFIKAYAISTVFHSTTRYRFWTSFERHLMVANKMSLNNIEALDFEYDPQSSSRWGFEREQVSVFRPSHDVFGNQRPKEAADSPDVFASNYNKVTDGYWIFEDSDSDTSDNGAPWEKDWRQALPQQIIDGGYNADDIALWLWERFVSDGGANYGALERAHILGLLATERDLLFLLCVRQRRFDLGESPYYLSALEAESQYCVPGEGAVLSAADKDLLQYPWTEDDIANTSYIVALVNEMAARSVPLDSTNQEVRDNANELMGMAVNFIVGTPYIFGQEASHP